MFGAGNRMGGNEMDAGGNVGRHVAQHGSFDRADVGNDCAWLQMPADLLGDRAALTDRDGNDDKVRAFDRCRIGLHHLIGEAELRHPPAGRRTLGGRDDRARGLLRARRPRDRGADQTHADQCEALEHGGSAHCLPMNSASAPTTSRLASSLPTVNRSAFGSL